MKVSELRQLGGFVSTEFEKKEAKWMTPSGEEVSFSVFVKKPSVADSSFAGKCDSDGAAPFWAALVHRCIRFGEKAEEQITVEDAANLDGLLFVALQKLVIMPDVEKKRPTRKKSSGANLSSTASAAKQSRKPRKT